MHNGFALRLEWCALVRAKSSRPANVRLGSQKESLLPSICRIACIFRTPVYRRNSPTLVRLQGSSNSWLLRSVLFFMRPNRRATQETRSLEKKEIQLKLFLRVIGKCWIVWSQIPAYSSINPDSSLSTSNANTSTATVFFQCSLARYSNVWEGEGRMWITEIV